MGKFATYIRQNFDENYTDNLWTHITWIRNCGRLPSGAAYDSISITGSNSIPEREQETTSLANESSQAWNIYFKLSCA